MDAATHLTFLSALLVICSGHQLVSSSSIVSCKNSGGDDVDWWVALKLPRGKESIYIDPHSASTAQGYQWVLGEDLASTHANPLAETLQPLYGTGRAGSVLWNDEFPNGTTSFSLAHAKGVFGFGPDRGFWLVHSAPRFPDSPSAGNYTGICCGDTAQQLFEGQSFLCLSLPRAQLEAAAQLLRLPSLFLYDWTLPAWSAALYPAMAALVTGGLPSLNMSASQALTSAGGEPFVAFAKATTPLREVSLFEGILEPYFSAGMEVQSWLLGRNAMPSMCPPQSRYESLNVRHVYVRAASRGWDNSFDHSKWAITIPPPEGAANTTERSGLTGGFQGVACVGDMNRMKGQLVRGGGAVCFARNTAVWLALRGLISAIEGCHGAT